MLVSSAALADEGPGTSAPTPPTPPTPSVAPAGNAPTAAQPTEPTESREAQRAKAEREARERELSEREGKIAARAAALDLAGKATVASVADDAFRRAGRIVFPEIVGVSAFGLLGPASPPSGLFVSGLFGFATSSAAGDSATTISFRPRADLFLTDRWTAGLALELAHGSGPPIDVVSSASASSTRDPYRPTTTQNQTSLTLGAAPRTGYVVDLGPVYFWPNFGVGYATRRTETGGSETLRKTFSVLFDLDFVFPITSHVLLDVGPTAAIRASGASLDETSVDLGFRGHLGVMF